MITPAPVSGFSICSLGMKPPTSGRRIQACQERGESYFAMHWEGNDYGKSDI